MSRAELKANAKSNISGKVLKYFVTSIVIGICAGALTIIPVLGALLIYIFMLSDVIIFLKLYKGEDFSIGDAFSGFKIGATGKTMLAGFLMGIFEILWSMLFVIPGIIKSIAYSMTFYIIAENPEISATDAIKKSQEMMQGHKMEYFILQLSFIPWLILVSFTFGLAGIYVMPYMSATRANFYKSISGTTAE